MSAHQMGVVPESEYTRERSARLAAERALEAALVELADTRPHMRRRAQQAILRAYEKEPTR